MLDWFLILLLFYRDRAMIYLSLRTFFLLLVMLILIKYAAVISTISDFDDSLITRVLGRLSVKMLNLNKFFKQLLLHSLTHSDSTNLIHYFLHLLISLRNLTFQCFDSIVQVLFLLLRPFVNEAPTLLALLFDELL